MHLIASCRVHPGSTRGKSCQNTRNENRVSDFTDLVPYFPDFLRFGANRRHRPSPRFPASLSSTPFLFEENNIIIGEAAERTRGIQIYSISQGVVEEIVVQARGVPTREIYAKSCAATMRGGGWWFPYVDGAAVNE